MSEPPLHAGAPAARGLLYVAAFVVVVAGVKAAESLLVPFLLALFIAVVAAPPMLFLRERGVPEVVALAAVVIGLIGIGGLMGGLVGGAVDGFSAQLPHYQARLRELTSGLIGWLAGYGLVFETAQVADLVDPGAAMRMVSSGLGRLGGVLSHGFLILLTVIFLLAEACHIPRKIRAALDAPEETLEHLERIIVNIKRYMVIKTSTSLLTGVVIAIWLWAIGIDHPALWGLLAFLLNFVPNIGSIIAAIPALLLALVQLGPGATLWAALGYLAVNNLVGNWIEPRFMGRGLGLSTLVVFVSLVFWGWVLGPVGMFLSVPLTMTLKIGLESSRQTRRFAALLGP